MKFSEIQQFTRPSNYRIDMPWNGMARFIEMYEGRAGGVELDPDFQRGHVWSEEQQIAFVEFRVRGGMTGREIYFNQPGHMSREKMEPLVLVDGLQRWTAVTRFLNDELVIFGDLRFSDFDGHFPMADHAWSFSIHINNLDKKADVLKWYLEMNTGGVVHSSEELARVQELYDKEISDNG